ncbi:unnamed protein product [Musa hybrid cultivar]
MMRLDKQGGQPFEITEAESPASSSGRSYCFPLLFLSLALVAAAVLIIIFVLKPKKPSFHLHAIQLDSSDAAFSKGANQSSAIASLLVVAHNPNKLGIRYSSTELGLVYDSSNMGLITVPGFFQPPHSTNVTILVHVFFKTINLGELLTEKSMQGSSIGDLEMRIFGGIQAQLHAFNFRFPKIKVFLDCRISAKLSAMALSRVPSTADTHRAFLLPNFLHLTHKCSLDLCI